MIQDALKNHSQKPPYYALKLVVTMMLMTLCSLLMLLVATITFFNFPRVYREKIAKNFALLTLWVWGIKLLVHLDAPFTETQTIYISNHTSTLDMFILLALGLPNARFFLSGYLRKIIPMGIIGYIIGIFWTVDQKYSKKRVHIFKQAERILSRTKESVYLSPEGERVITGKIGHFNKGSFHLATALHVPIIPLFIAIPNSINPYKGCNILAGTVHVYVKAAIQTNNWKLEEIVHHKEEIREMFVSWNEKHQMP